MTKEEVIGALDSRVARRPPIPQIQHHLAVQRMVLLFLREIGHGDLANAIERADDRYFGFRA
jgi:hypothetical protein